VAVHENDLYESSRRDEMYWFAQCLVGLIFFIIVFCFIIIYILYSMIVGLLKLLKSTGETILDGGRNCKYDTPNDDKYKINDK
jgi:TRAP-type mannitol/chloroaromatic compound transport system permease small subunit